MRLIDADELKENIFSYANEPVKLNDRRWDTRCTAIIADMNGIVDNMSTVGGWISVKDRLPEGECIAYSRKSGEMMMGFIGETDEGDTGYCCDSNTEWLGDVTHWMSLPAQPKEESDD